jgi:hypothetical protein
VFTGFRARQAGLSCRALEPGHLVQRKSRSDICSVLARAAIAVAISLAWLATVAASASATGAPTGLPSDSSVWGATIAAGFDAKPTPAAPVVTLNQPPARSNDATPSFSGQASGTTTVTVEVYSGQEASGTPVATLEAEGTGGSWASASVSPALEDGIYTAVATQPSPFGDATGESAPVTFEIDTRAPTVSIDEPPPRSNDTTPSFSGSASEATKVTVEIFEGTRAEGNIVAIAGAQGTGGSWTTGPVAPALPRGRHTFTALATQPSELGNSAGRSSPVTFVVDTEPPTITLSAPPSPSSDVAPTFSGTTSEATPVTIEIFAGEKPEGKPVASALAPAAAAGAFTSGETSPALSDGTFTAVASAPSAIDNGIGRSAPVTFRVDTASPAVTMNALVSPSADRVPSFSGTATDHTPVTVRVYRGGATSGTPVVSSQADVADGEWATSKTSPALEWGEYTAVATQTSSIGNPAGTSAAVRFAVEPIGPTVATEAASSVARSSAALYASVDPRGAGVSACYFEYGRSTAYGASIECGLVSGSSAFPPAAVAAIPVFVRIFGLAPATTYHYRIVAVGEGGTSYGADETFTTLPPFVFGEEGPVLPKQPAPHAAAKRAGIPAKTLLELVAKQLRARQRTATIAALLRSGGFGMRFDAPEAGSAEVEWSIRQRVSGGPGGHSAALEIARGALVFRRAGRGAIQLRLTHRGRQVLQGAHEIQLTETCVFRPPNATAVRASATIQLRR